MSKYGPNDFDSWVDSHSSSLEVSSIREELGGLSGCSYWVEKADESPANPDEYIITPYDDDAVTFAVDEDSLNEAIFNFAQWVDSGAVPNTYWKKFADDVLTDPARSDYDATIIDGIVQYSVFGELVFG